MPTPKFITNLGTQVGGLLVGTVFAGAGWLVTHTVDSVVSVPTVEYDFQKKDTEDGKVSVIVRNLSEDHKFSNLEFMLRLPIDGAGEFQKGSIEPVPPAYVEREPVNIQTVAISYPAIGLHPRTSIKLKASYTGYSTPTFHIEPSSEGGRVLQRGYLTWIIRNDTTILFGLLIAWGAAVITGLSFMPGGSNDGK